MKTIRSICLYILISQLVITNALCQNLGSVQPYGNKVWVGPNAFSAGRTLRSDYLPVIGNEDAWPQVLSRTNVFKTYLMFLPADPLPGQSQPQFTDKTLQTFATFINDHNLQFAIETGGLRGISSGGIGGPLGSWGKTYAESELKWLKRWNNVGGHINYITTDHAIMINLFAGGNTAYTMQQLVDELVQYFVVMRDSIPGVKFGCIESLGYFHVRAENMEYSRTVSTLPIMYFEDYFTMLLGAMDKENLILDHFHIDYGFEGVKYDGRNSGNLDFGRIMAVQNYVRSKGVRAGVIFNAFHDQSVANPDTLMANKQARNNTIDFVQGFLNAGGTPDDFVFQSWQPFPVKTGPETDSLSDMGIYHDILILSGLDIKGSNIYDSKFISQNIPAIMEINSHNTITLKFKNTGDLNWNAPNQIWDVALTPSGGTGDDPSWIEVKNTIVSGDTASIIFDYVPKHLGTYTVAFRLIKNGSVKFGDLSPLATFSVKDTKPPVVLCLKDTVLSNASGAVKFSFPTPIATDNHKVVSITQTKGLASGSAFPTGITSNVFVATDSMGNKGTCMFNVKVDIITHLEPIKLDNQLDIFPNPSNGTFTLKTPINWGEDFMLQVFALDGRMVYSEHQKKEQAIDITLPVKDGIYFIQISTGQKSYQKRVVIQSTPH